MKKSWSGSPYWGTPKLDEPYVWTHTSTFWPCKLELNWSGNVSKPGHANNGLQNLFDSFCLCRREIPVTITNCLRCPSTQPFFFAIKDIFSNESLKEWLALIKTLGACSALTLLARARGLRKRARNPRQFVCRDELLWRSLASFLIQKDSEEGFEVANERAGPRE